MHSITLADCWPAHLPHVPASNDEDDGGNQRGDEADVKVELTVGRQVIGERALKQLVGCKISRFQRALFKLRVAEPIGVKMSGRIMSPSL